MSDEAQFIWFSEDGARWYAERSVTTVQPETDAIVQSLRESNPGTIFAIAGIDGPERISAAAT